MKAKLQTAAKINLRKHRIRNSLVISVVIVVADTGRKGSVVILASTDQTVPFKPLSKHMQFMQVQSWRKQHAELEKLATGRDTTGRKRRRLLRTPKDGSSATFPEMEVRLLEWIRSCREDDHVLLDGASVKKQS